MADEKNYSVTNGGTHITNGYEVSFNAWCGPTTAANQLG